MSNKFEPINPDKIRFEKRSLVQKLPAIFQTDEYKRFFNSSVDFWFQPQNSEKLNGFIGQKPSWVNTESDYYVRHPTSEREFYSLEPAAVSTNRETGTVASTLVYQDFLNDIRFKGGIIENPNKLFGQQYYSWQPPLDVDKITNFSQYVWVKNQLQPIEITSKTDVVNEVIGQKNYSFETTIPPIEIGQTQITFPVNLDNFYDFPDKTWNDCNIIKIEWVLSNGSTFKTIDQDCWELAFLKDFNRILLQGISPPQTVSHLRVTRDITKLKVEGWDYSGNEENSKSVSLLFFLEPDYSNPDLFEIVEDQNGIQTPFSLSTAKPRRERITTSGDTGWDDVPWDEKCIEIDEERFENKPLTLSSGMVIILRNDASEEFTNVPLIVEGVGRSIRLVKDVFLDEVDFLEIELPDYVTIERSAIDNNPWSRTNRWFHRDVVNFYDGIDFIEAQRPIIEFKRDIELYNFGNFFRDDVDLILNADARIDQFIDPESEGVTDPEGESLLIDERLYVNETFWDQSDLQSKVDFVPLPLTDKNGNPVQSTTLVPKPGAEPSKRVRLVPLSTGRAVTDIQNQIVGWTTIWDEQGWDEFWWDGNNDWYEKFAISDLSIDGTRLRNGTKILVVNDINEEFNNRIYRVDCIDDLGKIVLKLETNGKNPNGSPERGEVVRITQGNKENTYFWFDGSEWVEAQQKIITNQEPLFTLYDNDQNALDDPATYPESTFRGNKLFTFSKTSNLNVPFDLVLGFRLRVDDFAEPIFENKKVIERYQSIFGDIIGYYYHKENAFDPDLEIYSNDWNTVDNISFQRYIQEIVYDGPTLPSGGQVRYSLALPPRLNDDGIPEPEDMIVEVNDRKLQYGSDYILLNDEILIFLSPLNQNTRFIVTTTNPNEEPTTVGGEQRYTNNFNYTGPTQTNANVRYTLQVPESLGSNLTYQVEKIFDNDRELLAFGSDYVIENQEIEIRLDLLEQNTEFVVKFWESIPITKEIDQGNYEIPLNLQANADNKEIETVSRSQLLPHFLDAIRLQDNFEGQEFYRNNYRDTAKVSSLGTKILQHTGPLLKTMILSARNQIDFMASARYVDREYNRFRNKFIKKLNDFYTRGTLTENDSVETWFSEILTSLTAFKTNDFPFWLSNMGGDRFFIPPTPQYLGIMPVYKPEMIRDRTYFVPVDVIVGHDNSQYVRNGDIRDDVILHLENKIYDSILEKFKGETRPEFDYITLFEGKWRKTEYSLEEKNQILQAIFERWIIDNRTSYRKNEQYDPTNPWTWNYSKSLDWQNDPVPGYWYGIYRYFFDTVRPNTHPWEMLGFSEKPSWWDDEYGPGPRYTRNNTAMWQDIANGTIKRGPRAGNHIFWQRPNLLEILPIDEKGALLDPISAGIIPQPPTYTDAQADFSFGDGSPVEEAWYRSNNYGFAVSQALFLMKPANFIETYWDSEKITFKNNVNNSSIQLINERFGRRPSNEELSVHGERDDDNNFVVRIGIQQWITDKLQENSQNITENFGNIIRGTEAKLATKMSGFIDPDAARITSESFGVLPEENFQSVFYQSPSIREEFYGGVLVIWNGNGYMVWGFDVLNPSFRVIHGDPGGRKTRIASGSTRIAVQEWKRNVFYSVNTYVIRENTYYICIRAHDSGQEFDPQFWQVTSRPEGLPDRFITKLIDGREGDPITEYPYGHVFASIQELGEFLFAYERYLEKNGWIFDYYDEAEGSFRNWDWAARRFLEWTRNRLSEGQVIALSPSSLQVKFKSEQGFIESIEQIINGVYSILNPQGYFIDPKETIVSRINDTLTLSSLRQRSEKDLDIYACRLYLSEFEHVLVFDNQTVFNDTIYLPLFNVRVPRLVYAGLRTKSWNGRLDAPGYIVTDNTIIPNFEKSVNDFRRFYDIGDQVEDDTLREHANHLIGFQSRDYLDSLVVSNTSQVNFYQGMIQSKGSPSVLNRLLRSDFITNISDLTFFEEWAFRQGEFGAVDTRPVIEFQILQRQYKQFPQLVTFNKVTNEAEQPDNQFDQAIEINDLVDESGKLIQADSRWIRRRDSENGLFATREINVENGKQEVRKGDLPQAGYVVPSEVTDTFFFIEEILTLYENSRDPENEDETGRILSVGETYWIHNTGFYPWSTYNFDWTILKLINPASTPIFAWTLKQNIDDLSFIDVDTITQHNLEKNNLIIFTSNTIEDNDSPIEGTFVVDEILSDHEIRVRALFDGNVTRLDLNPDYRDALPILTEIPELDGNVDEVNPGQIVIDFAESPQQDNIPNTQPQILVWRDARFRNKVELETQIERDFFEINDLVWIDNDTKSETNPRWATYRVVDIDPQNFCLELIRCQNKKIDSSVLKNALLYDTDNEVVKSTLQVFDPAKGKIPGIAAKEIDFLLEYDPAKYTNGTPELHQIDPEQAWFDSRVGTVWWDLSTLRYLDYEIDSNSYRQQNWGTLAPRASIDIYEWIRSPVAPAEWPNFIARGGGQSQDNSPSSSGEIRDEENPSWSQRTEYDQVNRRSKTYYYFWVKNKISVPAVDGRQLSVDNITRLIRDPSSSGLPWFAAISPNAVLISGIYSLTNDENTAIQINWTEGDPDINRHQEWFLMRNGDANSQPPEMLYRKMIDSITGVDEQNNIVPDPSLPLADRYGILFRPRQSMFLVDEQNRPIGSRRAAVEASNIITSAVCLDDERPGWDENFYQGEPEPTVQPDSSVSFEPNLYGAKYIVENFEERDALYFSGDLERGDRIVVRGTTETSGLWTLWEYKNDLVTGWDSSTWDELSENATSSRDIIETFWQENDPRLTKIIQPDQGINGTDLVTQVQLVSEVEPRQNVVETNSDVGWDRSFDPQFGQPQFTLIDAQKWRLEDFWSRTTWFDNVNATSNTLPRRSFQTIRDANSAISSLNDQDIIQVNNDGDGKFAWYLVDKTTTTSNFIKVAKERCTLQLSEQFFNPNREPFGFENTDFEALGNDLEEFRRVAGNRDGTVELRIILELLKNDVFTGEEINRFWFFMVLFAHSEQSTIDWAFKTSFITVSGFNEQLEQTPLEQVDITPSLEDYISEVKPYHVKLRDITRSVSAFDQGNFYVTDFDKGLTPDQTSETGWRPINIDNIADAPLLSQRPTIDYVENYQDNEVVRQMTTSLSFDRIWPTMDIEDGSEFDEAGFDEDAFDYDPTNEKTLIKIDANFSNQFELPNIYWEKGAIENVKIVNSETFEATILPRSSYETEGQIVFKEGRPSGWDEFFWDAENWDATVENENPFFWDVERNIPIPELFKRGSQNVQIVLILDRTPPQGTYVEVNLYRHAIERYIAQLPDDVQKAHCQGELEKVFAGIGFSGTRLDGGNFVNDRFERLFEESQVLDLGFDEEIGFDTSFFDDETVTVIEISEDEKQKSKELLFDTRIYGGIEPISTNWFGDNSTKVFVLPTTLIPSTAFVFTIYESGIKDDDGLELVENQDYELFDDRVILTVPLPMGWLLIAETKGTWIAAPTRPEDISIDGGNFAQPLMGPNKPEELVSIRGWEPVDIRVHQKTTPGIPIIAQNKAKGDGIKTEFELHHQPQTVDAIFVYVDGCLKERNIDYQIDWDLKSIKFLNAPSACENILITSFNLQGTAQICGYYKFYGDEQTSQGFEIDQKANEQQLFVTVNGNLSEFILNNNFVKIENITDNDVVNITIFDAPKFVLVLSETFKGSDGPVFELLDDLSPVEPQYPRVIVYQNEKRLCGPDIQYFKGDGVQTRFDLQNPPCCFRDLKVWVNGKRNTKEEVRQLGTWSYGQGFDCDVWDAPFDPVTVDLSDYSDDYTYRFPISETVIFYIIEGFDFCNCPIITKHETEFTPCQIGYPIDDTKEIKVFQQLSLQKNVYHPNQWFDYPIRIVRNGRIFYIEEFKKDSYLPELLSRDDYSLILNPFGPDVTTDQVEVKNVKWSYDEWDNFPIKKVIDDKVYFIKEIEKNNNPSDIYLEKLNPFGIKLEGSEFDFDSYDYWVAEWTSPLCEPGTWDYVEGWDDDVWDAPWNPEDYPLDGKVIDVNYQIVVFDPNYGTNFDFTFEQNIFEKSFQGIEGCDFHLRRSDLEIIFNHEKYDYVVHELDFPKTNCKPGTWDYVQGWDDDVWDAPYEPNNYPINGDEVCSTYFETELDPLHFWDNLAVGQPNKWDTLDWDDKTIILVEKTTCQQNIINCPMNLLSPVLEDVEYEEHYNIFIENDKDCGYYVVDEDNDRQIELAQAPVRVSGKDNQFREDIVGTWSYQVGWDDDVWDAEWNEHDYPLNCDGSGKCSTTYWYRVEPRTLPLSEFNGVPDIGSSIGLTDIFDPDCFWDRKPWDIEEWDCGNPNLELSNENSGVVIYDPPVITVDDECVSDDPIEPGEKFKVITVFRNGVVDPDLQGWDDFDWDNPDWDDLEWQKRFEYKAKILEIVKNQKDFCCNKRIDETLELFVVNTAIEIFDVCEPYQVIMPNGCDGSYVLCHYPSQPPEFENVWITRDFADVDRRCPGWDENEWDNCFEYWDDTCIDASSIIYCEDFNVDYEPDYDELPWDKNTWDEQNLVFEKKQSYVHFCSPPSPDSNIIIVNPTYYPECGENCVSEWDIVSSNKIKVQKELKPDDYITVIWFRDFFGEQNVNTHFSEDGFDDQSFDQHVIEDTDMKIRTHTFNGTEGSYYLISRPPYNSDYLWVSKNGERQIEGVHFKLVKIRSAFDTRSFDWGKHEAFQDLWDVSEIWALDFAIPHCCGDRICVTSFSAKPGAPSLAFKMFTTTKGDWEYNRIEDAKTYFLYEDITSTSMTIKLKLNNFISRKLIPENPFFEPKIENNTPGVIFIENERIEYWDVNGPLFDNMGVEYWELSNLLRGSCGTPNTIPELYQTVRYKGDGIENTFALPDGITTSSNANVKVYISRFEKSFDAFDEDAFDVDCFDGKSSTWVSDELQYLGQDYIIQNNKVVFNNSPLPPEDGETTNIRISVFISDWTSSTPIVWPKDTPVYEGGPSTQIPGGYQWRFKITPWDDLPWDQPGWGGNAKPVNQGFGRNDNLVSRNLIGYDRNK